MNKSYIQKKKNNIIDDVSTEIFPLSPCGDLNLDASTSVYVDFLSRAFAEKRICNIAVTGNFGIGKSSVIRTFCKVAKKKFIYVSLAEFNERNTEDKDDYSRQKLECAMLRQIIATCHKKDLPYINFEMVKEKQATNRKIFACICLAIYILLVFTLIFAKEISELVHFFFEDVSLHFIHLSLYALVGIITSIAVGTIVYQILMRTKIREISANISNSGVELGTSAEIMESCLEQYCMEMIYILEILSQNYDAIVFEDMDRLNRGVCIDIFSRLREINHTVNERLVQKKIRFIYVINDKLISQFDQTKFFDYIMPILPMLGSSNVTEKMKEMLIEIGINGENAIPFIELAKKMSEFSDYRMVYHIKNEYRIFEQLEKRKMTQNEFQEKCSLEPREKAELLAFTIYKVLLPMDYYMIREGKSVFFPNFKMNDIKTKRDERYIHILDMALAGYLSPQCMRYIGYSQDDIFKLYHSILKSSDNEYKRHIIETDSDFICGRIYKNEELRKKISLVGLEDLFMFYLITAPEIYVDVIESFIETLPKHDGNEYSNYERKLQLQFGDSEDINKDKLILEYFVKREFTEFDWLTEIIRDNMQRKNCLSAISSLSDESIIYIVHIRSVNVVLTQNIASVKSFTRLSACLVNDN